MSAFSTYPAISIVKAGYGVVRWIRKIAEAKVKNEDTLKKLKDNIRILEQMSELLADEDFEKEQKYYNECAMTLKESLIRCGEIFEEVNKCGQFQIRFQGKKLTDLETSLAKIYQGQLIPLILKCTKEGNRRLIQRMGEMEVSLKYDNHAMIENMERRLTKEIQNIGPHGSKPSRDTEESKKKLRLLQQDIQKEGQAAPESEELQKMKRKTNHILELLSDTSECGQER